MLLWAKLRADTPITRNKRQEEITSKYEGKVKYSYGTVFTINKQNASKMWEELMLETA